MIRSFLIVFEGFSMSLLISMAAFALASSITPGPVNIVALSAGARYGFWPGMRHVLGATLGFTLLLLLIGFGLHETLQQWPFLTRIIQWAGVAFLLYMAFRLATDSGRLSVGEQGSGPSMLQGAIMQWLNPKAWLASIAGMGVFVANGEALLIWQFAAIYCVVCYLSLGCWAFAGSFLSHYLRSAAGVRVFNRIMALLLVGCALYLVI
ncbi:Efflux protein, LysE family [Pseudomonas syringae pv. persicae]|nr:Efflux protein, LysE family [Pseudomonas syringae pv. persicae]